MKILVVGPGAIGRLLAARLKLAGIEVGILDRDPERAGDLRRQGIALRETSEESPRVAFVEVEIGRQKTAGREGSADEEAQQRKGTAWDLVVVCVKAYDLPAALEQGIDRLRPGGAWVILSNGLGILSDPCDGTAWPPDRQALGGTISYGAAREGTRGVIATGEGRIRIGALRGAARDRARQVAAETVELLRRAGFAADQVDDIESAIWEKMAINCAINPVATILGLENGRLPDNAAFLVAVAAAREVAAVARVEGYALPLEGWRRRVEEVCRSTARNQCSMFADLRAGRRTEIEELNGVICARGRRSGVATPVNDTLTALVRGMSAAAEH